MPKPYWQSPQWQQRFALHSGSRRSFALGVRSFVSVLIYHANVVLAIILEAISLCVNIYGCTLITNVAAPVSLM